MKAQRTDISPVMQELSAYIATAVKKPLPPQVAERARVHLVDTYAAMISGSRLLPGRKAIAYVKARGGNPEAGVIGTRLVTSIPNAVLANAMLAHADETDDTHPPSRTHPGSGVVPAALAIGERDRLSGTAVLRAIVLGYDVCARIMLAVDEVHFRRTGHHPSAFGRIFGAAAAAGALLGLDARRVRFLLSYASQQAAGLSTVYRDAEHIEKASLSGMPAHNGVAAALMVAEGFTGVDDVFSGERSFFYAFAPEADQSRLTRGLGRDFEILRCGIKRWPAGGPIQGPLHVLRDLMRQHGFKAGEVEKLTARMPEKDLHSVNNRDMPDICAQHLLAVMLLDGTVTFQSAHDYARMKNPQVLALRRRVEAVGDPGLNDAQRRWRCVMEITLKDGRRLAHQTMAAKGTSEDPLTREDEQEKALDLIGPVLGRRRAEALTKALWDFDRIKDVRVLRKLAGAESPVVTSGKGILRARGMAGILAAAIAIPDVGTVSAQSYPVKPVRIVTSAAGGSPDFVSRVIAQGISGPLGQQVVVDNRSSGIVPAEIVARAAPDGYTLLFSSNVLWLVTLMQKTSFDPVRDFLPITMTNLAPAVLVVHPSVPAKSVRELIALAKARPGELNYSSSTTGTASHLAGELFKALAGVNMVRIAYKGAGLAINDLISGQVQLTFVTATSVMPHVKSGRLRALAVTTARPSELFPGLPTVAASGVPGYEATSVGCVLAPAKTPEAIISRLNHEIVRFVRTPEVKEKFAAAGSEVIGGSPDELAAAMKSEMARMGKVIRDAGIHE